MGGSRTASTHLPAWLSAVSKSGQNRDGHRAALQITVLIQYHHVGLLAAAVGAAALLVGSGRAFAAPEKEPGHSHSWAYGGVMQAATTCVGEGHVCLNHCLNTVQAGDNSLIACGVAVQQTIAGCNALAQLASSNSAHANAFAEACSAVCSDCEKECRKHASKHDACCKCADACQALVREVKKAA